VKSHKSFGILFRRIAIVSCVAVGLSLSVVAERADACCSYVFWHQSGKGVVFRDVISFEQTMTPVESTGNGKNYWATQWTWSKSNDGGYTGVQTAGTREDEKSTGPVALFSLWGATSATPGPNSRCRPFDWEGIGILCRIDLPTVFTENSIRVERSSDGQSWTGSIQQPNGEREIIGTIKMPDVNMMWNIQSWVEYFGANNEKQCDALIGAAAYLTFPKFTLLDGSSTSVSDAYFTTRPCIRSTMVETIPGKQVFLAQGQWTYPTLATPTTIPATAPTTTVAIPAVVSQPTGIITLNKTYAANSLAKKFGVNIMSPKATVTLSIAKSSLKTCALAKTALKTLRRGNCVVTFTVQEPLSKNGKKSKATKTTKLLVVQ
jgi:hypothetical protein